MANLGYLIPGLILGLGSTVSAYQPPNVTFTNTTFNNVLPPNVTLTNATFNHYRPDDYTSTKTLLSTATIYNPGSTHTVVVASVGGHQPGSSQGSSAGTSSGAVSPAVVLKVGSQAQSPANSVAAFQTVIVTQTVAGCALGESTGAPSSTANHAPFAIASSSIETAEYAAATVQPAVHWDYPLDNLDNLIPSRNASLYYGLADPKVEHPFASVVTDLTHDTVILDHSSYVSDTSCSADGILVSFSTTQAFNLACDSWASVSTGLVLSTYVDGCHGDSENQRTFWLIASLSFDNKTLTIKAVVDEELGIGSIAYTVDLIWGTYTPGSNGSPAIGVSTSSAGGAKASSTYTSKSGASNTLTGAVPTRTSTSSGNGTLYGSSCGAAPSSVVDGLPAIDCGDADFDSRLDDRIGYLDTTSGNYASSVSDFLPNVKLSADDLVDDDVNLARRDFARLQKRGFFGDLYDGVVSIGNTIVDKGKEVGTFIAKGAEVVVDVGVGAGKLAIGAVRSVPILGTGLDAVAGGALKDFSDFNPSISGSQSFNYGPPADDDSPWGKAASIYSKKKDFKDDKGGVEINLYCVDCGVKGSVSMAGQAKWNLKDGLQSLDAGVNANIEAGVHLGLAASASYKDEKTAKIINQPLPKVGVAVGKLFTAGVYISVDAKAAVDVAAEGQVLVGVVMKIPNFEAKLNLYDAQSSTKSSVTGFTPEFTKRFEARGKLSAQLTLSLPIAINAGIEIPPLSLKRTLALIEEPSVYGNTTIAASTANAEPASESCNNGIEYFANVRNDIKLDFLGLKTFTLHHYESPPLLEGCKKFGDSKATTKASPSQASSATSADSEPTATDAPSTTTTVPEPTATDDGSEPSDSATTAESTATDSGDAPEPTETGEASEPSPTDSGDAPEPTETGTSNDGTPTDTDGESAPEPTSGTEEPASNTEEESAKEPASDSDEPNTNKPATISDEKASTEQLQRRHARSFMIRRQENTTATVTSDTSGASDPSDSSNDDENYVFDDDSNYVESFDNDVATDAELADDASGDYSDDPDNAAFIENTNKALQLASVSDSPTDANYTSLIDISKTLAVVPSANGNLYAATYSEELVQTNSILFGNYNGEVFGDDSGRLLHFHPDEMAVYKASRLRLSDEYSIPKTADFITLTLQQLDDASEQSVYFAADTYGNLYSIVMCNFANSAVSKLFVVDGQDGLDALVNNENVKFTITGAPVQECYPLALIDAPSS
ncbi:hypothetical protein E4T44_02677 [Aureobasidium sp. EXF-8845]|nr:hypothetical protein E4T44_02677 [Aureobasidium sp. EXF-8845]KAI4856359.1 hypothetical protein E4T45_02181 [Aureobasidium sp. EXF-8846]